MSLIKRSSMELLCELRGAVSPIRLIVDLLDLLVPKLAADLALTPFPFGSGPL